MKYKKNARESFLLPVTSSCRIEVRKILGIENYQLEIGVKICILVYCRKSKLRISNKTSLCKSKPEQHCHGYFHSTGQTILAENKLTVKIYKPSEER